MFHDQKIAVTGANGFVGSHVCSALGARARGIVRRAAPGRIAIAGWTRDELVRAFAGVHAVVHAASVVHKPGADAREYEDFNVAGTRTLIDAARAAGVRHVVFLSSIKVHGEDTHGTIDEQTPLDLASPYASSKAAAERLFEEASREGGPTTTILRLCPVFGIGDKGNVRKVVTAVARRRFLIPGDGSTRKSLVHVSVVAQAVARALEKPMAATFVVADSIAPSIRELGDTVARAVGRRPPFSVPIGLVMAAARVAEGLGKIRGREPIASRELIRKSMRSTVCSPTKLEREFAMSCHVDLAGAIAEEVAWLRRDHLL